MPCLCWISNEKWLVHSSINWTVMFCMSARVCAAFTRCFAFYFTPLDEDFWAVTPEFLEKWAEFHNGVTRGSEENGHGSSRSNADVKSAKRRVKWTGNKKHSRRLRRRIENTNILFCKGLSESKPCNHFRVAASIYFIFFTTVCEKHCSESVSSLWLVSACGGKLYSFGTKTSRTHLLAPPSPASSAYTFSKRSSFPIAD